jgi:hypothetical protein
LPAATRSTPARPGAGAPAAAPNAASRAAPLGKDLLALEGLGRDQLELVLDTRCRSAR